MKPLIQNVSDISDVLYGEELRVPVHDALERIMDTQHNYHMLDAFPELLRRQITPGESYRSYTVYGCTVRLFDDGSITVRNVPSSNAYVNITGSDASSTLPEWLTPGRELYVYADTVVTGVRLKFDWYNSAGSTGWSGVDTSYEGTGNLVTIPDGAAGLLVRILVNNTFTGTQTTCRFHIIALPYKTITAIPQLFTDAERRQARENISAVGLKAYYEYTNIDVLKEDRTTFGHSAVNGVDYDVDDDGVWTISGTANSSNSWKSLIDRRDSMPEYLVPGKIYYLNLNRGTVPIRFYWYLSDGTNTFTTYTTNTVIKVPSNAIGTVIRYQISSGTTVNATVRYTLHEVTDGWLASVDANTYTETNKIDMSDAINTMLECFGYCHLGPGIFYVRKPIIMPDGSTLVGCGKETIVRLTQDSAYSYALKFKHFCTVSNLCVSGDYRNIGVSTAGERNGVFFTASYDGDGGEETDHCMMSNVTIERFSGSGLFCNNSARNYAKGLYMCNCRITKCHTGININLNSEFNKFVNVCVDNCTIACINNGGNNVFSCCTFHASTTGFYIDGTKNNAGHGTVTGCTFCHIGNSNNIGSAVTINRLNTGFVFNACQFWYVSLDITNSRGIVFNGCEMGKGDTIIQNNESVSRGVVLNVDGGGLVLLSGCSYHNDDSQPPVFNVTNGAKVRMTGCYGAVTGNEITVS